MTVTAQSLLHAFRPERTRVSASSAAPRHGRRLISTAVAVLLSTAGLASTAGAVTAAPSDGPSASRSQTSKAVAAGRYIVTFADEPAASYEGGVAGYPRTRPDAGRKLDPTRPEVIRYRDRLTKQHDAALTRVGASKLYSYTVATNGVLSDLTAEQARTLSSTAGVRLEKDAVRTLDTTETPAFLGLSEANGLWSKLGGDRAAGTGVIVGVIDSGIWPEAPSFAGAELKRDRAGQPVEASGLRGRWFGACDQGEQWNSQTCNDKLIGARFYVAGFGKQNIAKEEYLSPRDGGGHGTHTASTAAGNRVTAVAIDGEQQGSGIASGMAPGADVAAYKVCWEAKPGASAGCFNGDSIAAIDDAVADGVDVINFSVGGSSESSPLDSVEQAYRRASNANVFVANSAGNSGPGASTLDHPSPWLTTVAASTFRKSEKAVKLGDGQSFVGASISPALLSETKLVASAGSALASADPKLGRLCYPGTLDPAKVRGTIVQCDRGGNGRAEKSVEVKRAGGVGMVLTNTGPGSLNSDYHAVPTVHVGDAAGAKIKVYIATAAAPTAAFVAGSSGIQVPEVAEFSSRGPSTTTGGDILKPDIAAPGVDVLAAVAPPSNFGRSYDYYSGTSMSSPHIAGIGALIRALHKDWSPSEVKSAMMTTAKDHASSRDPFAQGAGFVVPNRATDPGLVFPTSANDYRRYMVGLGVQFAAPNNTLTALDGSDLNQASLAIGALAGRQVVTRTVRNVSDNTESYTVSHDVPGLDITASVSPLVVPKGESKTFTLTVTQNGAEIGKYAKGSLTFTGDKGHVVRIPVAVKPVAISAPTEISGTGANGSATYTVTAGFTGTLDTSVRGLAAGTSTAGIVTSGAPSTTPNASNAVFPVTIPAGAPLVRFDLDATSTTDDLDLYLYKAGAANPIDLSASAAGDEQLTYTDLPAGNYTLLVNGYDTGGGGAFTFTSYVVPTGDAGNLTVTDGKAVTLASPVQLVASWKGLNPSLRYLGVISYASATETTIVSIG